MSLIDKYVFESRSRSGCSNSDYRLCQTDCCGHFGTEDDELLDFYFDAGDLSKHLFVEKGVCCPFCGAKDLSYHEVEDFAEMPSEWRLGSPSRFKEAGMIEPNTARAEINSGRGNRGDTS